MRTSRPSIMLSSCRRSPGLTLAVGLFAALSVPAHAQQNPVPKPTDVVTWQAVPTAQQIRPGESVTLRISAEIAPGWSLYAMGSPAGRPLEIVANRLAKGFRTVGKPRQTGIKKAFDPNFDSEVLYFGNESAIEIRVRTDPKTAPGTARMAGDITFMACNDRLCLSPVTVPFETTIGVAPRR